MASTTLDRAARPRRSRMGEPRGRQSAARLRPRSERRGRVHRAPPGAGSRLQRHGPHDRLGRPDRRRHGRRSSDVRRRRARSSTWPMPPPRPFDWRQRSTALCALVCRRRSCSSVVSLNCGVLADGERARSTGCSSTAAANRFSSGVSSPSSATPAYRGRGRRQCSAATAATSPGSTFSSRRSLSSWRSQVGSATRHRPSEGTTPSVETNSSISASTCTSTRGRRSPNGARGSRPRCASALSLPAGRLLRLRRPKRRIQAGPDDAGDAPAEPEHREDDRGERGVGNLRRRRAASVIHSA